MKNAKIIFLSLLLIPIGFVFVVMLFWAGVFDIYKWKCELGAPFYSHGKCLLDKQTGTLLLVEDHNFRDKTGSCEFQLKVLNVGSPGSQYDNKHRLISLSETALKTDKNIEITECQ